ncbi:MAG: protein phosphatase CheZ [Deltaproteobacteria bacterium]|nr:protein phosphatase CheZ [Deltaproteobacteria bacterium]
MVQIKFEISAPGNLTGTIAREATGDIYQILSKEMRDELGRMAKKMAGDIKSLPGYPPGTQIISQESIDKTKSEVNEMTDILDTVIRDTENAANTIFDSIEAIETNRDFCADILGQADLLDLNEPANRAKTQGFLRQISKILEMDRDQLTGIIQTLSFQDLTGQKIKRIIRMLQGIQAGVIKLLLTMNYGIQSIEQDPTRDITALKKQAADQVESAMMELKGPTDYGLKQDSVDKVLADLGF